MSDAPRDLPTILAEAEPLLARGGPDDLDRLGELLDSAAHEAGFGEEWHDLIGRYWWAKGEAAIDRDSLVDGQLESMTVVPYRVLAGRHWLLSPRDDGPRVLARALALAHYDRMPLMLFHDFRFPDLPFGRYPSPEVNARLEHLRRRLAARGCDERRLRRHLAPRRPPGSSPPPMLRALHVLLQCGCLASLALVLIVFLIGAYATARLLLEHLILPWSGR
jgi:hypothetical protein